MSEPRRFRDLISAQDIEEHTYDQVQGVDKMLAVLENALEQYNESNAVMDLVLFEDAMKHIARISRADSEQKMNLNLTRRDAVDAAAREPPVTASFPHRYRAERGRPRVVGRRRRVRQAVPLAPGGLHLPLRRHSNRHLLDLLYQ